MNTNSYDILLLKLIKQGDQIAFRHLFYQYADSLERFIIIRKTKNSSFKNEKSKKEVDVAITVSNKDIV